MTACGERAAIRRSVSPHISRSADLVIGVSSSRRPSRRSASIRRLGTEDDDRDRLRERDRPSARRRGRSRWGRSASRMMRSDSVVRTRSYAVVTSGVVSAVNAIVAARAWRAGRGRAAPPRSASGRTDDEGPSRLGATSRGRSPPRGRSARRHRPRRGREVLDELLDRVEVVIVLELGDGLAEGAIHRPNFIIFAAEARLLSRFFRSARAFGVSDFTAASAMRRSATFRPSPATKSARGTPRRARFLAPSR